MTGDDGALMFAVALVVVVENDPIMGFLELMSQRSVREHGSIVSSSSLGVEDRQPGFPFGIEAMRGDPPQRAGLHGFPIFPIYVEEFFDGRFGGSRKTAWLGLCPDPTEPGGERIDDPLKFLGSDPFEVGEPAVVCGYFELLQRMDVQVVVEPRGKSGANPGNRGQQRDRIHLPSQAIQHRQPAGENQRMDGPGQAHPDAGKGLQAVRALLSHDVRDGSRQPFERVGRSSVRPNTEAICPLLFEECRHFSQFTGDRSILFNAHGV